MPVEFIHVVQCINSLLLLTCSIPLDKYYCNLSTHHTIFKFYFSVKTLRKLMSIFVKVFGQKSSFVIFVVYSAVELEG